jgi:ParB family transcriptional regulator, chromosome partitioning protein
MTTPTTTTSITAAAAIPLNRLTVWEGNVRKTDADKNIDELAASIGSHGLLQPLIVRPGKKGKHAVAAGGRRLAALQMLAKAGKIEADAAIKCHVLSADADAAEISLVENTLREQMHPADQFEAFNALVSRGASASDIAARFGVTETVVLKRLKLARVSPVIISAYRKGKLDLEQVIAFTVSDDHKAQEKCLKTMHRNCPAARIREHLTEGEIAASHRLVKYVTLKAYEKAGGQLRRDLFAEDDEGVFILDSELLHTLAVAKLEKAGKAVAAEGWKWTAIRIEREWSEWGKCTRLYPEPVPLDAKTANKLAGLEAEHDQLEAEWEANDDEDAEYPERLRELSGLIEKIEEGRVRVYPPEALSIAGAVVSVGYNGRCEIERGYVLPEDKPKKPAPVRTVENEDGTTSTVEVPETFALSKPLVENLTLHKSAALTAELMERPDIALAYLVFTLAVDVFGLDGYTCLDITLRRESFGGIEGSKAFIAIEAAHGRWAETISGNPDAFLKWCLAADQSVLLDLLAFCTAISIEAAQGNHDDLAAALKLDMANWFTPTAENYFSRISKAGIIEALKAHKGSTAPAWEKAKKSDLAAIAERELSGLRWLPDMLKAAA